MQYAVHLTVRRRVQAFRVRKNRWAKIKLAKEKEEGERSHTCSSIHPNPFSVANFLTVSAQD